MLPVKNIFRFKDLILFNSELGTDRNDVMSKSILYQENSRI